MESPPPAAGGAHATGRTRAVVIVSVDGLRPDAIDAAHAPTLARLARAGRTARDARTVLPSLTLPSHVSMLTGRPPADHGVIWNDEAVAARGYVRVPTVFAVARAHGRRAAAFFGKPKFRHLMAPGTLDYAQAPADAGWGWWRAGRTVDDATAYLARTARAGTPPDLLFVHLAEPDVVGHRAGWMSWPYGVAVRWADGAVARIVDAADAAYGRGAWTLVVTADHGGHGRRHGSADPRDVTIPWIAWGAGVAPGTPLPAGVRTTDTAATALWLLGLPVPAGWEGRPVTAAFAAPTTR